jgi:hypothetical protein
MVSLNKISYVPNTNSIQQSITNYNNAYFSSQNSSGNVQQMLDLIGSMGSRFTIAQFNPTSGVGYNNTNIMYSYNSLLYNFTNLTNISQYNYKFAYNGTLWVCGGYSKIYYSYDGITWTNSNYTPGTPVQAPNPQTLFVMYSSSNNTWYLGCSANNSILSSGDGINWNYNTFLLNGAPYGGATDGNMIIFTSGYQLYYPATTSYSNQFVMTYGSANSGALYFQFIVSNGYMWIAGGSYVYNSLNYPAIIYSVDGRNWNESLSFMNINPSGFAGAGASGAAWSGFIWVVCCNNSNNGLLYSYDGINWLGCQGLSSVNFSGVTWNGTFFVASNINGGLFYSNNGIYWYNVSYVSSFGPARAVCARTVLPYYNFDNLNTMQYLPNN